ncbi:MAG: hypothetical protein KME06_09490 [Kastovskya adunca ATA6-11-RM4]|jgi:hypothetical protein|nr:hypothetical protein [Kastovskya adunca ATA6-11-RM4]
MKIERVEGSTPNNGAYALVYYQAADGSPVEKKQAVRGEIVEFSAKDKPIAVSFIVLSPEKSETES